MTKATSATTTTEINYAKEAGFDLETISIPTKYRPLFYTLLDAFDQAAYGKGEDRHGLNKPFLDQPIFKIMDLTSTDFSLGQAIKKIQEASTLLSEDPNSDAAIRELQGAIIYLAGAILHIKQKTQP